MGHRLVWLVVCAAAIAGPGCHKSPASADAAPAVLAITDREQAGQAQAAPALAEAAVRQKTAEEKEAEYEQYRLKWDYSDDGGQKHRQDYRLLPKAERDAIDELRSLVRKRPKARCVPQPGPGV